MNETLLDGLLAVVRRSVLSNAKVFDVRTKEDGKSETVQSFARHCGGLLNEIFDEARTFGAPKASTSFEAMLAMISATYLDFREKSAVIVLQENGVFTITLDGELWIEGSTDEFQT